MAANIWGSAEKGWMSYAAKLGDDAVLNDDAGGFRTDGRGRTSGRRDVWVDIIVVAGGKTVLLTFTRWL